jgi:hypothetical protein
MAKTAMGHSKVVPQAEWLAVAPKGRDEDALAYTMAWVRHHDRYGDSHLVDQKAQYESPKAADSSCCAGEASPLSA